MRIYVPPRPVLERDSPSGAQYFVASVTVGPCAALIPPNRAKPAANCADRVALLVIGHRAVQDRQLC